MKSRIIISAVVMSVLALIVGIMLTTHTHASAAATTPRAYTVIDRCNTNRLSSERAEISEIPLALSATLNATCLLSFH